MVKKVFVLLIIAGIAFSYSCNNSSSVSENSNEEVQNKILQQDDGTISLKVDKADCYHDMINPATNTAEWNVVVSKTGRYNVWLTSSTKDTTNLKYKNNVMLSILDNRIEGRPACDRIVLNSKEVSLPYFRADSFMGALYIQDTGLYSIQLISEKIIPKNYSDKALESSDDSRILSVYLTPVTR